MGIVQHSGVNERGSDLTGFSVVLTMELTPSLDELLMHGGKFNGYGIT